MEVSDSVNSGHRDMSLKDWTAYYESRDRDSFMTMSVEFSRTKLEKCITLPEIVRHVLYFCVQYFFLLLVELVYFHLKLCWHMFMHIPWCRCFVINVTVIFDMRFLKLFCFFKFMMSYSTSYLQTPCKICCSLTLEPELATDCYKYLPEAELFNLTFNTHRTVYCLHGFLLCYYYGICAAENGSK